jgi:hypothetical protein
MTDENKTDIVDNPADAQKVTAAPPIVAPGEDSSAQAAAEAPVSAICEGASANAQAQVDDDSEIKPVEGFFLTSQRWH